MTGHIRKYLAPSVCALIVAAGLIVAMIVALGSGSQRAGAAAGPVNAANAQGPPPDKRGPSPGPSSITDGEGPTYNEPAPPACGDWARPNSTTVQSLSAGDVTSCTRANDDWIMTTASSDFARGVVAVHACGSSDSACLDGKVPDSAAMWRVYRTPAGGAKILFVDPDGTVWLDAGGREYVFDARTGAFEDAE